MFVKTSSKRYLADESVQTQLMGELKNCDDIGKINKAFNKLYDALSKPLWQSLAKKYIPPLNQEEMQDVFQEAWVKIVESRKNYDETKKAYNWIYTVFKNLTIDKIRSVDRKKTVSLDDNFDNDDNPKIQLASENSEADLDIINSETMLHINSAIASLDDEIERIIIIKRIIDNLKFDEISKELNIPIATVHYKLNKALTKLRNKLNYLIN
jgi:RNA polymerase sigma-70 factor (ECF subfamily)